ncbi:rhodanese-like domain-containing protein [Bathymodiolus japonicus methanotrophic gill symbiont]|uniref:rhodanese-like domain-containing protein n=1 Tax=Bathymodiolus japonicus methanotrophic gill symbiont TaxID=113269 RepID=UPI001C8E88DD|nr:rhodanese-like domain-containing protein [Bathymodiolus japonicus methanotrophic gill symbiont]
MTQVSPQSLQQQLQENPQAYFLLDVREPFEYQIANLDNSVLIPMNQIPEHLVELNKEQKIVVICHHGMRSENVAYYLDQQGFGQVFDLTGGIDAWARKCDSGMALY